MLPCKTFTLGVLFVLFSIARTDDNCPDDKQKLGKEELECDDGEFTKVEYTDEQCVCKLGYLKDDNGKCIEFKDCKKQEKTTTEKTETTTPQKLTTKKCTTSKYECKYWEVAPCKRNYYYGKKCYKCKYWYPKYYYKG